MSMPRIARRLAPVRPERYVPHDYVAEIIADGLGDLLVGVGPEGLAALTDAYTDMLAVGLIAVGEPAAA